MDSTKHSTLKANPDNDSQDDTDSAVDSTEYSMATLKANPDQVPVHEQQGNDVDSQDDTDHPGVEQEPDVHTTSTSELQSNDSHWPCKTS